jgi:hypothetical protein
MLNELYELNVQLQPSIDFGITPEGKREDIPWTGEVRGKINGKYEGVDYLLTRNDGVRVMHVHGVITVNGDTKISIELTGYVKDTSNERLSLIGALSFWTGSKEFEWLNSVQGIEEGYIDLQSMKIYAKVFTNLS